MSSGQTKSQFDASLEMRNLLWVGQSDSLVVFLAYAAIAKAILRPTQLRRLTYAWLTDYGAKVPFCVFVLDQSEQKVIGRLKQDWRASRV